MVPWPQNKKTREFPEMLSRFSCGSGGTSAWVSGGRLSPEQWALPGWLNWDPNRTPGTAVPAGTRGVVVSLLERAPDPQIASCSLEMCHWWIRDCLGSRGHCRAALSQDCTGLWVWFTVKWASLREFAFGGLVAPVGLRWGGTVPSVTLRDASFFKGTVSWGAYKCRLWGRLACIWNQLCHLLAL